MSMSVKFDGFELNTFLDVIQGFTPYDGNDIEVLTEDIVGGGARVVSSRRTSRVMKMPFIMRGDLNTKFDKLNSILNKTEPAPLIIGAQPNRTYYAMATSNYEVDEKNFEALGTITFLIPEGMAYGNVRPEYHFVKESDGSLSVTVTNSGSEWASVDLEVLCNHENGFIGFTSEYGAVQLGDPQEVDAVPAEKSVTAIPRRSKLDWTGWTDGTAATIFGENSKKKHVVNLAGSPSGLGVAPGNVVNTPNADYYGGIKEYILDQPSKDWYFWGRFGFETALNGQTGLLTLAFVDANNNMIAAYDLYKSDKIGNTAQQTFLSRGKIHNVIKWTPSYWIPPNPYGNQSRSTNRDMFDLRKEGNRITFYWNGSYFSYTNDSIKDVEVAKVQLFVGQYKGRNFNNQRVTRLYLDDCFMIANKVPYMKDVPNRYPENTTIVLDGKNRRPYVNNQLRLSDEVIGSNYFLIPPGQTKLELVYSDFSIPEPTAKCWINEVYR